jgi:hypothetical protein
MSGQKQNSFVTYPSAEGFASLAPLTGQSSGETL